MKRISGATSRVGFLRHHHLRLHTASSETVIGLPTRAIHTVAASAASDQEHAGFGTEEAYVRTVLPARGLG